MKQRLQISITGSIWAALAAWSFYKDASIRGAVFAGIAAVFLGSALLFPRLADRIHRGLGAALNFAVNAVSLLLLTLIYFLVFAPLGLFLRATGKLHTTKRPDRSQATYWIPRQNEPVSEARYRRTF